MDQTRKQPQPVDASAPLLHDELCEKTVLGTIISNPYVYGQVRALLSEDYFYDPLRSDIYRALSAIDSRGERPDLITIPAELSKGGTEGGFETLVNLLEFAEVGDIDSHVRRLHDLSVRRRFWTISQKLMQGALTEIDDIADVQAEAKDAIDSVFSAADTHIVTLSETTGELLSHVARNMSESETITGTPTGFRELDSRGGMQGSDLVVIAGETSMGKSALALTVATNAALSGAPVAYYSLEMSSRQLTARIVAGRSGVSSSDMLFTRVSDTDFNRIALGVDRVRQARIYFDDSTTSSLDKICASIRTMHARHGIAGAVVDYLQILNLSSRNATREQVVAEAARRLKNLAVELDIWIIALSQLSRNRDYPQPTLSRLRDSGQIEEAADTVILVYRPERLPRKPSFPEPFSGYDIRGAAYIDVAKGRNTGTVQFLAHFDGPTTLFTDGELSTFPASGTVGTAAADDNPF